MLEWADRVGAFQSHMNWILKMIEEGNEDLVRTSNLNKGASIGKRSGTLGGATSTKGRTGNL